MTSTGKIQQWSVAIGKTDECPYYEITYGQKDGQLVTTRTNIREGKNIGRANETTAEDQCEKEALALWTRQKNRKGYTEEIPEDKPLRPMLAKSYDKHSHKIKWPCYIQYKYDGIRCIYNQHKILSRNNKDYSRALAHLLEPLSHNNVILDGELYSHKIPFQEITSAVKRDEPSEISPYIQYYIYDIVDEKLPFKTRLKALSDLQYVYQDFPSIVIVPTVKCDNPDDLDYYYEQAIENGYEGLMLRNADGKYKINGRSEDLQKYKKFIDEEFKIVDIVEGKGKFEGLGLYVCEHNNRTFRVTPKTTESEKRKILENAENFIGKMLTVRFFEWTSSEEPMPRFPVGIGVRDYE